MRIRSVLAATALGIALAAAGASTATADEGPRQQHHHHFGGDEGVCSPYIGAVDTVSADIFWAGKHCDRF
ncbi:hypothetical protein KMT30_33365 [Streptomyces sp. IBSBF 2953]|uniref:hypothetical protein n=1 Tax=Streptomyces TaxID=1883 RepID=UPI00211A055A|nr:hypothetical protein [Streptomyces scabiei]MCQ9183847.1 hypothetical protein [Streptomyces hayashii]MDX3117403.1 hypothetical protein [Streptomyces scabiei]